MFTAYPRGRSGVALLTLRSGLGATLVFQACLCLAQQSSMADLSQGVAALAFGLLLTVGFLTPLVAAITAAFTTLAAFFPRPVCPANLFDGKLEIVLAGTILAAVFLLGPGAFSIDARLFGRREIIIPPATPRR